MRALLLLAATAALAGCNQQPAEPTLAQNEAAQRESVKELRGWNRVFGAPFETVPALNQYGFRLGDYRAVAGGYAARGVEIALSQSDAASPNRGSVQVTGDTADAIDRIVFTLPISDAANAATAKKRLTDIVRGFLFHFGIDDDGALDAIAAEQDADGLIDGAPVSIATDKSRTPRRITVTFQRPSVTAAAEPGGTIQQP